jgi:hypothetical protein
VDPWAARVVSVNDYAGVDMEFGVEEMVSATAMIAATIETIGEPGTGRWCCESPPLQVTDIEILGGSFPEDSDGTLSGIDYQALDGNLAPGDRVTMLIRDDTVAFLIFDMDGALVHPVPQHQADAIEAMRVREASSAGGWDPLDYSPLRAVTDIWSRYHSQWWGSVDQRVALAVSGVPGYRVTCSAADLGPLLRTTDYAPASEGLPSIVNTSRLEIVTAATSCDYDEILTLTAFVDGDDTDLFWWRGPTAETLIEADRRFGALRELTLALTNTTFGKETVSAPNSSGELIDQAFYIWPSAFLLLDGRAPAVQVLGEDEASRVAALSDISVAELDHLVAEVGGYALFRTAIDAAGNWRLAISGD